MNKFMSQSHVRSGICRIRVHLIGMCDKNGAVLLWIKMVPLKWDDNDNDC